MTRELKIYKGDTEEITFTVKNQYTGVVKDLTSYDMKMYIKKSKFDSDTDALVTKTATISAPATGIGVVNLTVTDTAQPRKEYYWLVRINNSTTDVKTTEDGSLEIL